MTCRTPSDAVSQHPARAVRTGSPARPLLLLALILCGTAAGAAAAPRGPDRALDRAGELIEAERPEEAIALLEPLPNDRSSRARALLLRSTARFMLGAMDEGRADLDRSLELDPEQRQAWLNRAGLDIAERRYEEALEALRQARRIDPEAEDNHLNIGAVLLLQGRIEAAGEQFDRYLSVAADPAEARYLVAKNYAGRGYVRPAVESLREAVERDERYRLLARADPAFEPITGSSEFRQVLETDAYTPPEDHRRAVRAFEARYDAGDGPLLSAVLESLRTLGESFDPRVEVAEEWAVIHGRRLRVKIYDRPEAAGAAAVRLTAPPEAFRADEWAERSERLFREIQVALIRRQRPTNTEESAGEPGRKGGGADRPGAPPR